MINAKRSDIQAKGSFDHTSFQPEQRERGWVQSYLDHMRDVTEEFGQWTTDENEDQMHEDLERYRTGYAKRMNAYLSSHRGLASQMITGSGGWTGSMVRSHEKKVNVCDNRLQDLVEWSEAQLDRLRRRYDPARIARAPIDSGDPDAITKLEQKIERAERRQATYKAANQIIRKNIPEEEKRNALLELEGITVEGADKLLTPDYMGNIGFPSWLLQNNNANIRRMRKRIEELSLIKNMAVADCEVNGVRYVENKEANRVQFFFPGKPDPETRNLLKKHGFRWAPSIKAWQRKITYSGLDAAAAILRYLEVQ